MWDGRSSFGMSMGRSRRIYSRALVEDPSSGNLGTRSSSRMRRRGMARGIPNPSWGSILSQKGMEATQRRRWSTEQDRQSRRPELEGAHQQRRGMLSSLMAGEKSHLHSLQPGRHCSEPEQGQDQQPGRETPC